MHTLPQLQLQVVPGAMAAAALIPMTVMLLLLMSQNLHATVSDVTVTIVAETGIETVTGTGEIETGTEETGIEIETGTGIETETGTEIETETEIAGGMMIGIAVLAEIGIIVTIETTIITEISK